MAPAPPCVLLPSTRASKCRRRPSIAKSAVTCRFLFPWIASGRRTQRVAALYWPIRDSLESPDSQASLQGGLQSRYGSPRRSFACQKVYCRKNYYLELKRSDRLSSGHVEPQAHPYKSRDRQIANGKRSRVLHG